MTGSNEIGVGFTKMTVIRRVALSAGLDGIDFLTPAEVRAKLAEQIAKLEAAVEAAEKSSAESDAGSPAEDELDLLKTLDLLYMQHLAAFE